jgi:hypothetical protein
MNMQLKKNLPRYLKYFWFALCAFSLLRYLYVLEFYPNRDYEASDDLKMSAVFSAFPTSFIFFLILCDLTDICRGDDLRNDFIIWGCALVLGYFQWFRIVPWLLRKEEVTTLGLNDSDKKTET